MSDGARRAINGDFLAIDRLPFRVGRNSRSSNGRTTADIERRKGTVGQVNEAYLIEPSLEKFHQISREHFLIDAEHGHFYVVDRHSVCGTIVAGKVVGGDRAGGRVELYDGDIIVVGTAASPYIFKFVVS
jgi:pSer/pThr/pTyr-binding forkhead associated (FHA) protein